MQFEMDHYQWTRTFQKFSTARNSFSKFVWHMVGTARKLKEVAYAECISIVATWLQIKLNSFCELKWINYATG